MFSFSVPSLLGPSAVLLLIPAFPSRGPLLTSVMVMLMVVRRRAERVLQPESSEKSPGKLALLWCCDRVSERMGVK